MRHWVGNVAAMLGGIAVACMAGEIAARMLWRAPDASSAPSVASELDGLREVSFLELGRPNVRGVFKGVLYETNSAGFRGPEVPRAKPAGVFRILALGDSFTMGSFVRAEDAYPAVLERALNASRHDRRYEVLNLGYAGLNLAAIVDRQLRLGLRFQPDLIVYGFTINDIEGPAYVKSADETVTENAFGKELRARESPSYLLRVLLPRWYAAADLVWPGQKSYLKELTDNYFHNPAAWNDFVAGLDELAAKGRARHACVAVFIHTQLYYLRFFHPLLGIYDRVAEAATERGLYPIRSFPYFRGLDGPTLWANQYDSHPNANGHGILARALLDGLEKLPPDCWHGP